jgi:hypothetical protein
MSHSMELDLTNKFRPVHFFNRKKNRLQLTSSITCRRDDTEGPTRLWPSTPVDRFLTTPFPSLRSVHCGRRASPLFPRARPTHPAAAAAAASVSISPKRARFPRLLPASAAAWEGDDAGERQDILFLRRYIRPSSPCP